MIRENKRFSSEIKTPYLVSKLKEKKKLTSKFAHPQRVLGRKKNQNRVVFFFKICSNCPDHGIFTSWPVQIIAGEEFGCIGARRSRQGKLLSIRHVPDQVLIVIAKNVIPRFRNSFVFHQFTGEGDHVRIALTIPSMEGAQVSFKWGVKLLSE
jgi:hypothetical protein